MRISLLTVLVSPLTMRLNWEAETPIFSASSFCVMWFPLHKKAEKRKAEVDALFAKMYEDWSAGRITEYNFNMLSEKYQGEQRELDAKIERLHEAMEVAAQTAVDAEKWIGLMKQYVNPTELTAELLNTLIEKILVHEAVKSEDGSREQEVEIFYRFIGKIE